jgi:hypothetical protein
MDDHFSPSFETPKRVRAHDINTAPSFNILLSNPKNILVLTMMLTGALSALGLFASYMMHKFNDGQNELIKKLVNLFVMNYEGNIPTLFSFFLLNSCCFLLINIFLYQKYLKSKGSLHWLFLSLIFFLLAFDEAASVHEKLIPLTQVYLGAKGWFHFGWIIPAGILVLAIGVFYVRFLMALPRTIAGLSLLAGALYIGGGLLIEMPEGAYAEVYGQDSFGFHAFTVVEETLEMVGLSLYLYTLMRFHSCLSHQTPGCR